jgi:hypothetical protein
MKLLPFKIAALVCGLGLSLAGSIQAQTRIYTFSSFAGVNFTTASSGARDGTNSLFYFPKGVAVYNGTNVYVADYFNNTIRKLTLMGTNWVASTFVGQLAAGYTNATGTNAQFSAPLSVAVDGAGNVYVADFGNQVIRKATPAGVVSTLAGQPGVTGTNDGTGAGAQFYYPEGVALDAATNVYVADTDNHTIRKITPAGLVTTLAGQALVPGGADGTGAGATFNYPRALAVDANTNIFVSDTSNNTIRKITPNGGNWVVTTLAGQVRIAGSVDATGTNALFNWPIGIAVDSTGIIYVADQDNNALRKITTGNVVTTLAGKLNQSGSADGMGTNALFYGLAGVAVSGDTNLFVSDMYNNIIRKVTSAGAVITIGGAASVGGRDGIGTSAQFNQPLGMVLDGATNLYVADQLNSTIRKITPAGIVSTIAGQMAKRGSMDGTGTNALFNEPAGIVVDPATNLYVADTYNNTIRKITPTGVVTTIAGQAGVVGHDDGTGTNALFFDPFGLAMDGAMNLYAVDGYNNLIRKLTPAGTNWIVTALAGNPGQSGSADGTGTNASFNIPFGIAVDKGTNLYVTDTYNNTIRQLKLVAGSWVVSTIAGQVGQTGGTDGIGTNALFYEPWGIAVDSATNLYVADRRNDSIRKISPAGTNWVVTTIGGYAQYFGGADGTAYRARFEEPGGLTLDNPGNLYVADSLNNAIRLGVTHPLPSLTITQTGTNAVVSWPAWAYEFQLETLSGLEPGNYWYSADGTASLVNTNLVLTNGISSGNAFYRLNLQ